jgi:hypothetical protein
MSASVAATQGPVRLLRGALVGAGGSAVSVLGHLVAGGAVPSGLPLAALAAAAVAVCWWLGDQRWTPTRLAGALVVVQSGLHLGLSSLAGGGHGSPLLMIATHLVATLVILRLLLAGEAWLWDLLDLLALRVVRLVRPLGVVPTESAPGWPVRPDPLATREASRLPRRRGPPVRPAPA